MKRTGASVGVLLVLAGCGGGGGDGGSAVQGPFAYVVGQARQQAVETQCDARGLSSVVVRSTLERTELRANTAGTQIEMFDEEEHFASADCSGTRLATSRLEKSQQHVPVIRVTYVSSLTSAVVNWPNAARSAAALDWVDVGINPADGRYNMTFTTGVDGSVQQNGMTTTASIINGSNTWQVSYTVEATSTVRAGLVRTGDDFLIVKQDADGSFSPLFE